MNRLSNELKRSKSELKRLEALNEKKTAELSAAQDKEIKLGRAELALKESLNVMTKPESRKVMNDKLNASWLEVIIRSATA